ncbi:MAG: 2-oxo acid dehydrogenase subunit E2 [Gammaproteobacteria bacterium]
MSDRYTIKMPQLSDTMTEGVLVSWEKNIGDKVERGDVVATVETDKAIMDVEVFREGYLSGPLAPVDSTVPVGEPIGYLVPAPEEVSEAEAPVAAPVSEAQQSAPEPESAASAETPAPAAAEQSPAAAASPEGVVHVIKMPQLSDTMTEGVVVSWEKDIGAKIERGDVVATVETDKAIMDVEVFREGYLSGPRAPVDSTVPVGEPLAYLVEKAEQVVDAEAGATPRPAAKPAAEAPPAAPPASAAAQPAAAPSSAGLEPLPRPAGKLATPYARKLAAEYGIDLNVLQGSGPEGAITGSDVQHAFQQGQAAALAPATVASAAIPEVQVPGEGRKMTALERAISHNMSASLTMPTFHVTVHARPEALIRAAKKNGVSVTVAIARACALAMRAQPRINWAYQPVDKLVERGQVDIGMAVAADDGGLVVPVLRDAHLLGLADIEKGIAALANRARHGGLAPDDLKGGTFSITNGGVFGSMLSTPILNPPQSGILGMHNIQKRPIVKNDDIVIRPMMYLALSYDHRLIDGADAVRFLVTIKETLEYPASLTLDL